MVISSERHIGQYSNDDHPQDALHFTWFPWREMNLCGVYNLCNINYVSCLCIFPAFRSVYFYLTNKSWQLTKKMFQGDLKLCELSFSNRHYITCLYSIYRGGMTKSTFFCCLKCNASQKDIKLPVAPEVTPYWWISIGNFKAFWDALGFTRCSFCTDYFLAQILKWRFSIFLRSDYSSHLIILFQSSLF